VETAAPRPVVIVIGGKLMTIARYQKSPYDMQKKLSRVGNGGEFGGIITALLAFHSLASISQ